MNDCVLQPLGPLPGLPTRHGADVAKARRIASRLRWLIRGVDPEPTPAQWRAQGQTLVRGDAPADRLVAWMRAQGLHTSQPLFERALTQGIDRVPDAPAALREFFSTVERPPAWLQPARLIEGAAACHLSGMTGLQVLRDAALMGGYQASAINRTLVLTGSLAKGAQRRVAETTKWWVDCTTEGGMERFSPGFMTTLRVRVMHALLRQRVREMPAWDESALGLPINQGDMQATYLGFCVIFLFGQRILGVKVTRAEAQAVMHLWRYIAWVMGVEDDLLVETEMQGRVALYRNLLSQAPPDESSRELGRALMDEPLHRHYRAHPLLARWQGRYERAKHLSICRLFLGRQGLRDLGLPTAVLPWYPAVCTPAIAVGHRLLRCLPGGRRLLIRRGQAAQQGYLAVLFGTSRPDIAHLPAARG